MMAIIASLPLANSDWSLFGPRCRVARRQDLEAEVARCGWGAARLVLGNLAEGHVGKDLCNPPARDLGDSRQAVRDVGKFQASRWRQISWKLASDPYSSGKPCQCEHVHIYATALKSS